MSRWHFREYAIEAAGLGAFMLAACAFTVFIEPPATGTRTGSPTAPAWWAGTTWGT